ncbi:MAG: FAD-dependent oxidoreductase [Candidatus Schekmanbacteria bacterium]|nr:MAG: FAD-dependent oxidoreductase [Candidatus Schekmanbacteria bacterium]
MGDEEILKFDAIVIGAGPSGMCAAYVMAKAGMDVAVIERGEYPGSKNLFGGILFTTILNKLIPNFWEKAPVERNVISRKFAYLTDDTQVALEFKTERYNKPPYNNTFTVLRSKFDRWFAEETESIFNENSFVFSGFTVVDVIKEGHKVVGVVTDKEGPMYADVVICAEGANSLIAEKAGLKKKPEPHDMVTGVKEVIALPSAVIEDRFGVSGNEGVAIEYFGKAVDGMVGGAFIYTNKESLSVGISCSIIDFTKKRVNPNDILDKFKEHPAIKNLLRGGETIEYAAHMIPEFGYDKLPQLVADGIMLVGDTAGFVNTSHYHEGSNLAMASGVMAGETAVVAKQKGDYSAETLSLYVDKLNDSFVMKDLKKFRKTAKFLHENPQVLNDYPTQMVDTLVEYFTISEKPKEEIRKDVIGGLIKDVRFIRMLWDMNKARKVML